MNKTKIVCTIGPASCSKKVLKALIKAGMNVVRLNGSHSNLEWHSKIIDLIRSLDASIPILLDLPGRKIRTRELSGPYPLLKGKEIVFTAHSDCVEGKKIPVNYDGLHLDLKQGDIILADDGTLKFRVVKICKNDVHCRILTKGVLKSNKGLNIPYVRVNTPLITERDKRIIAFALKKNIDWVGVSFVESGEHVLRVRRLLGKSKIGVISKIENKFGVDNIEDIIRESSGLLIDRGDLGAETAIENIAILQKEVIKRAARFGKPVIIATEMLHSMIEKPQPTKAEVMDISNSILDGASAIMLSGETAVGKNPVQAVKVMRSIANEVEKSYQNYNDFDFSLAHKSIPNAIGRSIYEVCNGMPITKVLCLTLSGYAARMISRYRISQPVLAVTNSVKRARKFNLLWGVEGVALNIKFSRTGFEHVVKGGKLLWRMGKLAKEDLVVFTAVIMPHKGSKMNYMQIHKVADMAALFGWKKKKKGSSV